MPTSITNIVKTYPRESLDNNTMREPPTDIELIADTWDLEALPVAEAQREPKIQPHTMVDDLAGVAMTLVRRRDGGGHNQNRASCPRQLVNVTMPY